MNNIEIWDINYNIDTSIIIEEFKKIQKRLFLLDTKKTTLPFNRKQSVSHLLT